MSHRGWMWHPIFCHWMTERGPDDGPSYPRLTVIGSVQTSPTPHCPIFSKCPPTDTCDGPSFHDGSSCTTVLVIRDPIPKCLLLFPSVLLRTSTTDRHTLDVPSRITVMTVRYPSPKGFHNFFLSVPQWTSTTDLHNHNGPYWLSVILVKDFP